MPVIGTPVTPLPPATSNLPATPVATPGPCCDTFPSAAQSPTLVSCQGMNVIVAEPATKFKQPLFGRIRTIKVKGGTKAIIYWTMQDRQGNPVKLEDCPCEIGSDSSTSSESCDETTVVVSDCQMRVKFRLREQVAIGVCKPPKAEFDVKVIDKDVGKVEIVLPPDVTKYPGIYYGEVAVLGTDDDGNDYVYFSNTFNVAIETGEWSAARMRRLGPPSFAEIRLHLRDSDPAENVLLADLMFDDSEIAMAIMRPIQYWNEIPPPIQTYTTQNFPFRHHWLEAIAGELFLMAAEGYRRNQLAYSAAGVAIDDQNKEMNYEQASARRMQNWRAFVKQKKASLNMEQAWGAVGSTYAGRLGF
jgi:hypothetical protein